MRPNASILINVLTATTCARTATSPMEEKSLRLIATTQQKHYMLAGSAKLAILNSTDALNQKYANLLADTANDDRYFKSK